MKKALLLLLCLLVIPFSAHAEDKKPTNTWIRICQDNMGMFHYFSSASIKQYPPNNGTVFDVSVRAIVTDEARKKDKRFARASYFVTTTHYVGGRGIYRTLSTIYYDAQGKIIQRNDKAGAEAAIATGLLAKQTLSAVQAWLEKNPQ